MTNTKISYCSGSMHYLVKGIRFLRKLGKDDRFAWLHHEWRDKRSLSSILKYGFLFKDGLGGASSQDIFSIVVDYLRTFFCAELFAYYIMSAKIDSNTQEIREIIGRIGYIDCLVCNSRLLNENNNVAVPTFQPGQGIAFRNLRHPLIEECVGQNLHVARNIIVTGMNMAGKSTFLRSVGINQILATSFGLVFADSFVTDAYVVVASMRVQDDVLKKKSKYYVEAERLLFIQEMLKQGRLLCLIDEILTGTNTEDRIKASVGLLFNYSAYSDSLILAATHDNVIAETLTEKYDGYYFDGEIRDMEIEYDYMIKRGVVTKRNAIYLLRYLGLNI